MSAPAKKRTLGGGENGKDVQAVQRAVAVAVRALGQEPRSAATGTFGDGTKADLKTFQKSEGIQASGSMGQPTLDKLWKHFDAYGRSLYFKAQLGTPSDLPHGYLASGMSGNRVRAAQQMFWRAFGPDSHNARNGMYGDGLEADVRHFCGVIDADPVDGKTLSIQVWRMIWAFGDEYAHELATTSNQDTGSAADKRSELVTWAEWYVAQAGSKYVQARPYQRDDPPKNPLRNDCSGSSSHLLKLAGFPDPSGNDFNGVGYTGTMMHAGSPVELPRTGWDGLKAGDLVFYGGSSWNPSHVGMVLDCGRFFTFGSDPPTITTYAGYWTSGRRYEIGARRMLA